MKKPQLINTLSFLSKYGFTRLIAVTKCKAGFADFYTPVFTAIPTTYNLQTIKTYILNIINQYKPGALQSITVEITNGSTYTIFANKGKNVVLTDILFINEVS